ncbi:MAG: hypothetical protein ACRD5H_09185 [Nitrososphaerales archaeon]
MIVKELRENKTKAISRLSKQGISVRQIAILLYDDDSERAQHRVRALISKLRKKKLSSLITRLRPQPQPFESQPQPQPKEQEDGSESDIIEDDYIIDEDYKGGAIKHPEMVVKDGRAIKHPEMVEKGKASDTVLSWLDEDALARQLADECYDKARKCYEEKDYENAFRFMELVTRFLRLSQTARKEYDLEGLKKAVADDYEL